jgi:hypothetical protein
MPLTTAADSEPLSTHNSLQAVVATLLDVPLSEVPFFFEHKDDADEWRNYFAFLKARGFDVIAFEPQYEGTLACPYIAIGRSRHSSAAHCVLRKGGKLIYDPHPDGGDLSETLLVQILCPLDPGRHTLRTSPNGAENTNG